MFNKNIVFFVVGGIGLSLGFFGCGSDTSTGSDEDEGSVYHVSSSSKGAVAAESSDDSEGTSAEGSSATSQSESSEKQSAGSTATSSATSGSTPASSSAKKKTETASVDEVLNEAKKAVVGTCGPTVEAVNKGDLVTWKFYRTSGDVYDQILAPFVWTFDNGKVLQGNGLQEVNVRYEEAGLFNASLNIDGTDVTCDPIQVQGVPIVINSCSVNAPSVKAGEALTWTVDATSESEIVGYEWSTTFEGATVTGNGTTATMTTISSMHKKNVSATVAVKNADNTTQKFVCDAATVLDPESVDLVLPSGDLNGASYGETVLPTLPDSLFITAETPMTVQIPSSATQCIMGCKPKVGSDYMNLKITWNNAPLDNFAYVELGAGCAGKKYTIETTVTAICVAN